MDSPAGQIKATDYAISYSSRWSVRAISGITEAEKKVLAHVNCSYLSSGKPPTLLALKQHAQSLTSLIRLITTSNDFMDVDNKNDEEAMIADDYTAFDWLNNLDVPYDTRDDHHKKPLWALMNSIGAEGELDGPQDHCALKTYEEELDQAENALAKNEPIQPFRSHAMLVKHANECMEQLDLEYKASGGLLSLLNDSVDEIPGIRNCIFGQWLLHHQYLTVRMHELEINYGQALELLDAKVMMPSGRSTHAVEVGRSRIAVMPQDKFIISHSDDAHLATIHDELDRREVELERAAAEWRVTGASTDRLLTEPVNGEQVERGIVTLETISRLYRLKGRGRESPIFVEPASRMIAGTEYMDKLRKHPAIIMLPTPAWPERLTAIERRSKDKDDNIKKLEEKVSSLQREVSELKVTVLQKDRELEAAREQANDEQAGPSSEMMN